MKIYYPSYYKDFKCIADRCRHSCCVGWEIGVDDGTMEGYSRLSEGQRQDILSNIDGDNTIILSHGKRCPFLRDDGLCRIIAGLGDSYVSHICREHPRFYHRVGDRVECGIGASCEEACRLILLSEIGEYYLADSEPEEIADETDFDTISHRAIVLDMLKDERHTYRERLEAIRQKYAIPSFLNNIEGWRASFDELEYLDEGHRGLMSIGGLCDNTELYPYLERFFAYLIFRHLSVADSYDGMRARLGFCLLLLSVLENSLALEADFNDLWENARIISEEIEYSEDNTASLIFEMECLI